MDILDSDDHSPNQKADVRRTLAHLIVNDADCFDAELVASAQTLLDN